MKMFLLGALVSLAGQVYAESSANAVKQKRKIERFLLESKMGVTSVGVGGCDPDTGLVIRDSSMGFVYCIIYTVTDTEALERLEGIYPAGTQINKVFVVNGGIRNYRPGNLE